VADEQRAFEDVRLLEDGFSIPELKWRELVFIGAIRPEGAFWTRDPAREMPPFRIEDLWPHEARFQVTHRGGRVLVRRV
jgi:hypothetical protein